jgi:hypothetical protein
MSHAQKILSVRLKVLFLLRTLSMTALAMPFFAMYACAANLPDTGHAACSDGSARVACTNASKGVAAPYPRQDERDTSATAGTPTKTGGGTTGFDYTKVANNGSDLAASAALGLNATDWACTRDNVTGLLWEVKTTSGLRSQDHYYTWYNSNLSANAGSAGIISGGDCHTAGRCDTEKFVADVNATALCSFTDWRLPSRRELLTLVRVGVENPSIDTSYFPNTREFGYWSGSSYDQNQDYAWTIYFTYGHPYFYGKQNDYSVRLVRGRQF